MCVFFLVCGKLEKKEDEWLTSGFGAGCEVGAFDGDAEQGM